MLGHINRTRRQHIVTIEDPIEILHPDLNCIVNQREVGIDTVSFHEALRRALRQDPDVILIGELRDMETAETALQAAESGHLVLSTMHTVDAAETLGRFVEFFPAIKQPTIRSILAGVLRASSRSACLPRADGGRVAAVEVMVVEQPDPGADPRGQAGVHPGGDPRGRVLRHADAHGGADRPRRSAGSSTGRSPPTPRRTPRLHDRARPRREGARRSRRREGRAAADENAPTTEPARRALARDGGPRYVAEGMNVELAALAFVPGLAIGSFLNVVAARSRCGARSSRRGSAACRARRRSPGTTTSRSSRTSLLRGRCRHCGARDLLARTRPSRRVTALLIAACVLEVRRARWDVLIALGLLRRARRRSRRPISSGGSSRTASCFPRPSFVLAARRSIHPSVEWLDRRPSARRSFLLLAALAYPGGMGMGDVKLALLLGAALGRTVPVALMVGMLCRPRALGRAARAPRLGGAQDGDPVRAVPRARRRRRALRRARDPPLVPGPDLMEASKMDKQPDLRLIDGEAGARRRRVEPRRADGTRARRRRHPRDRAPGARADRPRPAATAGGASFSQALVEEGFASALGVRAAARRGATTFRSSTSRSPASRRGRPRSIALAVLERVCAIPFSSDGTTLKVAITDPQDVHGIDELRLATRLPVEFSVAAVNDVMTEVRRLGRAERRDERDVPRRRSCYQRRGRARRPRGRRRHLRCAARPARQLDRSSRPPRTAPATSTSSRRRTSCSSASASTACSHVAQRDPEAARGRRHDAPEGAREARHRRAAQAAGRPHHARRGRRRAHARHPRRDAADRRGRVGRRCACSTSRARCRRSPSSGSSEAMQEQMTKILARPTGALLVTGPDRLGQVDDALRGAGRRSTSPRSTSSPSRTRSSTGSRASTRCRSTRAPA